MSLWFNTGKTPNYLIFVGFQWPLPLYQALIAKQMQLQSWDLSHFEAYCLYFAYLKQNFQPIKLKSQFSMMMQEKTNFTIFFSWIIQKLYETIRIWDMLQDGIKFAIHPILKHWSSAELLILRMGQNFVFWKKSDPSIIIFNAFEIFHLLIYSFFIHIYNSA